MMCFYYQNQKCKINPARRPEILNFDRVFPVLLSVEYYFFAFWTGCFFIVGLPPRLPVLHYVERSNWRQKSLAQEHNTKTQLGLVTRRQ